MYLLTIIQCVVQAYPEFDLPLLPYCTEFKVGERQGDVNIGFKTHQEFFNYLYSNSNL